MKNVEGLLFSLLTIPHNWPSTSKMIGSMRDHVDIIEDFPCVSFFSGRCQQIIFRFIPPSTITLTLVINPYSAEMRFAVRVSTPSCSFFLRNDRCTTDRFYACNSVGQGFAPSDDENPARHEFLHDPSEGLPLSYTYY